MSCKLRNKLHVFGPQNIPRSNFPAMCIGQNVQHNSSDLESFRGQLIKSIMVFYFEAFIKIQNPSSTSRNQVKEKATFCFIELMFWWSIFIPREVFSVKRENLSSLRFALKEQRNFENDTIVDILIHGNLNTDLEILSFLKFEHRRFFGEKNLLFLITKL